VQRTRNLPSAEGDPKVVVVLSADGSEVDRTISIVDEEGRLLEASSVSGGVSHCQTRVRYDAQHRPVETIVTFPNTTAMNLRIETLYVSDSRVVTNFYGSDGNLRARAENDGRASEMSKTIFGSGGTQLEATVELVDIRDEKGNWIRKTIFARDEQSGSKRITAVITRDITYY
jgi:hypothetical protein